MFTDDQGELRATSQDLKLLHCEKIRLARKCVYICTSENETIGLGVGTLEKDRATFGDFPQTALYLRPMGKRKLITPSNRDLAKVFKRWEIL